MRKNTTLFGAFILLSISSHSYADTVRDATITGVFVNKGSAILFTYEPIANVNNPNNCNLDYLQVDSNAKFVKEQYSLLLSAFATGKPVDFFTSTLCDVNMLVDWFYIKN